MKLRIPLLYILRGNDLFYFHTIYFHFLTISFCFTTILFYFLIIHVLSLVFRNYFLFVFADEVFSPPFSLCVLCVLCCCRGSSPINMRVILRSMPNITYNPTKARISMTNITFIFQRFSVRRDNIRYSRIAIASPPIPNGIITARDRARNMYFTLLSFHE